MSSIDRNVESWSPGRVSRDDRLANDLHAAGNMLVDGDPAEAEKFLDKVLAGAPKFPSLSFWTKSELIMQKQNFNRLLTRLEKLFAHKNGMEINEETYEASSPKPVK